MRRCACGCGASIEGMRANARYLNDVEPVAAEDPKAEPKPKPQPRSRAKR
jgi:hypothetical protein